MTEWIVVMVVLAAVVGGGYALGRALERGWAPNVSPPRHRGEPRTVIRRRWRGV